MEDRTLLKWGGISALIFVALLTSSIITFWVTGGIEFKAWVPLFSTLVCFLVVAVLAGYEYLAKSHYALARVGLGFAALSLMTLLLEAVVWGADKMVLRSGGGAMQSGITPLMATFNSLHMLVLWLIAIWLACWGAGLVRLPGKAKLAGTFMLLVAPGHLVDYALARLGRVGLPADLWHLGSQIMLLSSFMFLGLLLLNTSREEQA